MVRRKLFGRNLEKKSSCIWIGVLGVQGYSQPMPKCHMHQKSIIWPLHGSCGHQASIPDRFYHSMSLFWSMNFIFPDSALVSTTYLKSVTSTETAKPLNLVWWMSRIYHGFQVKSTMRVRISLVIVTVGTDHSQNEIWACNSKNSQRTAQSPMISWNGCKNAHFHSADIEKNEGPNFRRLVLRAENIFFVGVCFKT